MERPKNRDHGDWATNIALQLAKTAGTNPREFASVLSARLKTIDGVSAVDIAGPGFLNITVDAAAAGALAKAIVEAGAAYGTNTALAGPHGQHGVRLGQPHRPAAHRPHPLGRPGRRDRPRPPGLRCRRHCRVLHQRRRFPDERVRELRVRQAARPGRARGRLPGPVHRGPRPRGAHRAPGHPRTHRSGGPAGDPRRRLQGADARHQAARWPSSASTSMSTSPSRSSTTPARSRTPSPACANRATSSTTAARSGCAPPTSATTRTA